ncbi:hypothetical protein [Leptolyngbya sp. FACHB-261]|uniref:hypothetical protein n=1 Tax=Leptolyngbya sp. FACHB-261 TaxID=2692806 RepID=UPI001F551851|nr:hypothetical protein [Leptolyngbya sp. FACHB-261]
MFDPKGEWIKEQLRGYRLRGDFYEPITDSRSEPLQLRLIAEGQLISFYREDSGEKRLIPEELNAALQREIQARQQAERAERLATRLRALGVDPDAV